MPLVKCPNCLKPTEYDKKNPYRPFCSERCRNFDLAKWADEEYKVPDTRMPIDEADDLLRELLEADDESPLDHKK